MSTQGTPVSTPPFLPSAELNTISLVPLLAVLACLTMLFILQLMRIASFVHQLKNRYDNRISKIIIGAKEMQLDALDVVGSGHLGVGFVEISQISKVLQAIFIKTECIMWKVYMQEFLVTALFISKIPQIVVSYIPSLGKGLVCVAYCFTTLYIQYIEMP